MEEAFGASETYRPIAKVVVVVSGPVEQHGPMLNVALIEASEEAMDAMIMDMDLDVVVRGKLTILESHAGSWYIEALQALSITVPFAYGTLKAISEAPKIAEGLTTIQNTMKKAFKKRVRKIAPDATGAKLTMEPVQVPGGWGPMLADAQIQGGQVSITMRAAGSPLPRGIVSFVDGQFVRLRTEGGDVVARLDDISAVAFDDTPIGGPVRGAPATVSAPGGARQRSDGPPPR
ncbi:hypothetical protein [Variovorax sp. YR216]|uniref:hypothetical protein n=1 Tax=Variovorax sp. YR216 TaxID=1882828 RepID=UPI00089B6E5D|nr:hypothetical protein [Variovorax sp. YR216]SEB25752.1 hypothetical protein SAMN05444680_12728 [Variovorax sp. YR216]